MVTVPPPLLITVAPLNINSLTFEILPTVSAETTKLKELAPILPYKVKTSVAVGAGLAASIVRVVEDIE